MSNPPTKVPKDAVAACVFYCWGTATPVTPEQAISQALAKGPGVHTIEPFDVRFTTDTMFENYRPCCDVHDRMRRADLYKMTAVLMLERIAALIEETPVGPERDHYNNVFADIIGDDEAEDIT